MFGTILKAMNSYFRKGMAFCRGIFVKKVMKLLAFIFEQPSYHMCFSTGTRTPCSIRIRPCPESRQCLDLFVFYSIRPNQRYFSYVGTVLPVLNKY